MRDTIFAVSSGRPPAAIAIIRLSGPRAFDTIGMMAGPLPAPRHASLRALTDPADGALLDRALVLTFPAPGSATGEDLAELHLHGGSAVVKAVQHVLAQQDGLRMAEAGEFTRRAMENGRIDLTEAEGIADLLTAETEAQRRSALANAEGGLRRRVEGWADRAVGLSAMVEAAIDHSDEDDVDEAALLNPARDGALALADDIASILAQPPSERLRDGIRVVFAGPPNSGKSTLFNKMAGRDAAIVSPIAGTTRDRIEAPVEHGGIAWLLIDTAGLTDHSDDPIEVIGMDRSRAAIDTADLVLWLGDDAPPPNAIPVHARSDAIGRSAIAKGRIGASGLVEDGAAAVWTELERRAALLLPAPNAVALNVRQRTACEEARQHLHAASAIADPLIFAEELRIALAAFNRLTGRAHTEAMLDALFGRFCIGK